MLLLSDASYNLLKMSKANIGDKYGACCNEMDIWEASNAATAFTPHPCSIKGVYNCTEPLCGSKNRQASVCDMDGCDFNPYRNGDKTQYGPGANMKVDTKRPFTVVTQFITSDNTPTGTLTDIRRLYVQNGKQIPEGRVAMKSLAPVNSMTDQYCTAQKEAFGGGVTALNAFRERGGLRRMGEALGRGMVLAMSIWDDAASGMQWLDGTFPVGADKATPGVERGPCSATAGMPANIERMNGDAAVVFSKIRIGDIGSTYN
jgi:cellulose 1,4-beta-cellobiosidase